MNRPFLNPIEARANGQMDINWWRDQLERDQAMEQELTEFPRVSALESQTPSALEAEKDYQEISAGETIEFN